MTNKEYLRRINVVEFKVHGTEQEEALSEIEKERMESLEENLDIEWVKTMASEEFDDELENEYGNLFCKNFIFNLTLLPRFDII